MDLNALMQQAQAMQSKMAQANQEVEARTVDATAGGGAVSVTVSGGGELKAIKIDPQAVNPDDVGLLEDLILTAVNEGVRKAKDMKAQELQKLTGGMNIPGLF